MASRFALMKSHLAVRKACNDAVCAIKENPAAFDNIKYEPAYIAKHKSNDYKRFGLIGIAVAGLIKYVGLH